MVKVEVEILIFSSKFNVCMEELVGLSGNIESKFLEIVIYFDNF